MDDSKVLQTILEKLDALDSKVSGLDSKVDALEKGQRAANDRIDKLDVKVSAMQEGISELKEDSTITRGTVNTILEWIEKAQVQVQIPLFRK